MCVCVACVGWLAGSSKTRYTNNSGMDISNAYNKCEQYGSIRRVPDCLASPFDENGVYVFLWLSFVELFQNVIWKFFASLWLWWISVEINAQSVSASVCGGAIYDFCCFCCCWAMLLFSARSKRSLKLDNRSLDFTQLIGVSLNTSPK